MTTAHPDRHTFDLRRVEERDLMFDHRPDDARLQITSPTHGDPNYRSSSLFALGEVELRDLRDTINEYLDTLSC